MLRGLLSKINTRETVSQVGLLERFCHWFGFEREQNIVKLRVFSVWVNFCLGFQQVVKCQFTYTKAYICTSKVSCACSELACRSR